jgi:hypothetical protein
MNEETRRAFLTVAGAGALLAACRKETHVERAPATQLIPSAIAATSVLKAPDEGKDVGATEDLMREHGVIRRILVVYRLSATRLRVKPAAVPLDALQRAAKLMHTFGEEYHEKQLEEAHLFPAVKIAGGAAGGEIESLLAQRQRGREITDYILEPCRRTRARARPRSASPASTPVDSSPWLADRAGLPVGDGRPPKGPPPLAPQRPFPTVRRPGPRGPLRAAHHSRPDQR